MTTKTWDDSEVELFVAGVLEMARDLAGISDEVIALLLAETRKELAHEQRLYALRGGKRWIKCLDLSCQKKHYEGELSCLRCGKRLSPAPLESV